MVQLDPSLLGNHRPHRLPVRRALLSVSDKTGVLELAQALHGMGITLISTGGTCKSLQAAGLPVTPVEDVTSSQRCSMAA